MNTGYDELAKAIVARAAVDYLSCLRRLNRNPNNKKAAEELEALNKFIYSEWFLFLSPTEPEVFIEAIERVCKKSKRKRIALKRDYNKKQTF